MADHNPMASLTAIAIGALILIAIFMFVPYMGGTIEASMPDMDDKVAVYGNASNTSEITGYTYSSWNSSANTNLPDGADTWTTIAGLLTLAAVVVVISIVILYFKGML